MILQRTDEQGLKSCASGAGDSAIGTRIGLFGESGGRPAAAVEMRMNLPTGVDRYSSMRPDPGIQLNLSNSLNDRFSLGFNLGVQWATQREENDDLDTTPSLSYIGVLGLRLTEKTQTFFEFFGKTSTNKGGGPENGFDTGIAFRPAGKVQLDASVGFGLSEASFDWFVAAGFSLLVF